MREGYRDLQESAANHCFMSLITTHTKLRFSGVIFPFTSFIPSVNSSELVNLCSVCLMQWLKALSVACMKDRKRQKEKDKEKMTLYLFYVFVRCQRIETNWVSDVIIVGKH